MTQIARQSFFPTFLLLMVLFLGIIDHAFAASSGPNSPGVMTSDGSWYNIDNVKVEDALFGIISGLGGFSTELKATNFGFAVPNGAVINGIIVEIKRRSGDGGTTDYIVDTNVKIVKSNGAIGATNKADTITHWPTTFTYKTYGSSSDLWGESWASSDINNSNFGVVLSVANPAFDYGTSPNVDHIRITVYYTISPFVKAYFGGGRIGSGRF